MRYDGPAIDRQAWRTGCGELTGSACALSHTPCAPGRWPAAARRAACGAQHEHTAATGGAVPAHWPQRCAAQRPRRLYSADPLCSREPSLHRPTAMHTCMRPWLLRVWPCERCLPVHHLRHQASGAGLHKRCRRLAQRSSKGHAGVDNGHIGCQPLGPLTRVNLRGRGPRRRRGQDDAAQGAGRQAHGRRGRRARAGRLAVPRHQPDRQRAPVLPGWQLGARHRVRRLQHPAAGAAPGLLHACTFCAQCRRLWEGQALPSHYWARIRATTTSHGYLH